MRRIALHLVIPLFAFISVHATAEAQSDRQVISVTPPLFQISIAPGDLWQSTIRVVNGNPYDLTVYAERVNFAPIGEKGEGKFIPLIADETTSTLAEWINIASGPYVIPPEQSRDIPFFIEVPADAPPGGHFAAVLIGTQPPARNDDKLAVLTSQAVTSLFFLRIEGDVVESGDIREFSVAKRIIEVPEAEFILRFENKGNVHLQPKGDIIITNMWGKERGVIPINQKSHFGNVLPESIREFNFTWRGESSITEIGRYKAVVTLAYGENGIKSTFATTYFWVIPVKGTLITLGVLIGFILFVIWAVRLYVRRMLALAGVPFERERDVSFTGVSAEETSPSEEYTDDVNLKMFSYHKVTAPLRFGANDLRSRLREVKEFFDVFRTVGSFIVQYRIFFGSMLVLVVGFVIIVLFIASASTENRDYEVIIEEDGIETTVSSEEIKEDRIQESQPLR